MAISKVVVVDGNNLIVRIDRGVAGRGVTDVEPVEISGSLYLVFTFSDGTTETVGPVGTVAYVGQSPIVINASTISLSTVPINLGGTGQVTANAGFNALAPTQTGNSGKYLKTDGTNSAWDLLDISTADITGTLPILNGGTGQTTANASFNALAPSQATNTGKYLKTDGTNTSWDLLDISTADITGTLAITNGGTGATTASGARTNLGLGTIATQDASAVAITGGSITGITDLAVADGGTGASTAAGARTNLNAADQATTLTAGTGLSGGGDLSANRTFSITNTGVSAASYGSASNTLTATVNAQGQLTALAATPIAIANTQISGLGTISTQNANAVAITGGSITGITDLAVADGGTGASDAAGARTNLNAANQATTITAGTGLSGGGDLSANRTIDIANTTVTAGSYGSASNTLTATVNAQGQLTALAATPIAIANTQVSGLGTMSTQNSNAVTITGGSITGITDLAIADGGTGASNAADARSNLGLGSAAVLNAGVALGVATLDAGGTVPLSQIPASIQGGVSYQGAWNASTNTPTLVSSVGSKGYYYVVSVSGNTNLNGVTDWLVGDWAIYNGTAWQKIDNTDQVASVNGYTGVVVLSNTDVGAPPTSLTISAGTGLSGGGNLTTNRTLSIANTTVTAAPYGTASAVPTFTVNGQGQLTAASDVTIAIANTQVSGLGTLSTQNANSVAITGGSITGITDLAVADGGTGASNATDARSNLSAAYNAITISAGTGLTGGGDLTANRTLAIDSSVVTLTGTQTLTNKTLTSPLVNEILDTNGNEILGLSPTASATDFVTVKNGIGTGVPLHIYADGPSTNIGLHLQPKGSGLITISDGTDFNKGIRFRSSGSAASAVTLLDAVSTAGRVVTLPDATTTLVGRDTTDTLTNKTIAFGSNTFSGSLAIANGGTGQATANAAFNALAPSQTGNSGKYLTTDGTDTSWASNPLGTVTSVAATVPSFLSIAGSPITTSGTLAISLSGTALPTTSGGTGLTSFTANGVVYASSSSALTTGSVLTFDGFTLTNNSGSTAGTTGFSASNSVANGYTALTLRNTGASGKTFEVGVGGNGTAGNYQGNLYIRDTSGNPSFYVNSTGAGVVGNLSVAGSTYLAGRGTSYGLQYPDWQVYNTSINDLTFSNYTGDLMTLTQAGNLGIGRSNPVSAKLDVGADGTGEGLISQFTRYTVGPGIHGLYVSVNVTDPYVKLASTGSSSGRFRFFSGNNEVTTISNTGLDVPVGVLSVGGSRGVRLTGGGSGEVAIAGDGSTYVLSHNFYNTTSYATQLGGMFTYVAGGALQYISMGTAYNNAGIYINGANKVGIATNEPIVNFQVNAAAGLPSSSDVSEAAILVKDSGSNRRVGIGTYASGTWIQSAYPGVAGPAYPLILNPNGGAVGIGATSLTTNLVIGNTSASGGASGGLGVFLSRGVSTNFYEAFDGTKSFIAGVDNTQGYAKVGTLSQHPVALVAGNGNGFLYLTTSGNVSIGTTDSFNTITLPNASNAEGITWGRYDNIFGEYSSGGLHSSSNYYPTKGASGYKTSITATYGAAGISVSGTGATSNGGVIQFFVDPATSKTAGDAFTPTERARIDPLGTLLVGCTGGGASGNAIVTYGNGGDIQRIFNTQASSPFFSLISMFSDATTPSSPTGTLRVNITTNGGIANYQANDSNLSDRREKTNFAPAGSYLDKICAIPIQTFNYIDQNLEEDSGLTLGVVAQDVQAVAPELVMESNWAGKNETPKMRLSIYQTDLQYALMKCIQEQQAIIESLKTRLDAANL
jgi:hypothetical protein